MRLLSIIVLGLSLISYPSLGKQTVADSAKPAAAKLQVSIVPSKARFKLNEQFRMMVLLSNAGDMETHVLATLQWGISAGLVFHIQDASGRGLDPRAFPDDQVRASPHDNSAFVKLQPNHFIGTNFFAPLKMLSVEKPGKYSIVVEYTPRFSITEVELRPFWGNENGTIKSNVAYFEVVR